MTEIRVAYLERSGEFEAACGAVYVRGATPGERRRDEDESQRPGVYPDGSNGF
jgi:hypothetical protein